MIIQERSQVQLGIGGMVSMTLRNLLQPQGRTVEHISPNMRTLQYYLFLNEWLVHDIAELSPIRCVINIYFQLATIKEILLRNSAQLSNQCFTSLFDLLNFVLVWVCICQMRRLNKIWEMEPFFYFLCLQYYYVPAHFQCILY